MGDEWRTRCSAPLEVPTARPDDAPFVYVPLNPKWRDLFIDLCAVLEDGDIWADGQDVDEGYTSALIAADQFLRAKDRPTMDIGVMMMWPGVVPPDGWAICSGQELSRTTYAELFTAIGTNWGAGNGTTTFNIPDFRGRSPMGVITGLTTVDLGQAAGEMSHTLTTAEMPAHNHAASQGAHSHAQQVGGVPAYLGTGGTGRTAYGAVTTNSTARVVTDTATPAIAVDMSGSGEAHNNLHPVKGIYFIIWTGVV